MQVYDTGAVRDPGRSAHDRPPRVHSGPFPQFQRVFFFAWSGSCPLCSAVGWPGLLLGAVGGAFLWRRHRVIGAAVAAVVGLTVGVGVKILFR